MTPNTTPLQETTVLMRYVTLSEVIFINGTLLNQPQIVTGKQHVRDIGLLDAAVMRPEASAFGADAFTTLPEKAAALLHALARNHPFADGNKRTATIAALFMLRVNGARVVWDQAEALPVILDAAEGRLSVDALAAWLPLAPVDLLLEPDADADMRVITTLIAEQSWLLHELEQR